MVTFLLASGIDVTHTSWKQYRKATLYSLSLGTSMLSGFAKWCIKTYSCTQSSSLPVDLPWHGYYFYGFAAWSYSKLCTALTSSTSFLQEELMLFSYHHCCSLSRCERTDSVGELSPSFTCNHRLCFWVPCGYLDRLRAINSPLPSPLMRLLISVLYKSKYWWRTPNCAVQSTTQRTALIS